MFFFQYHSSQDNWTTDQVQRYFSFNGQPAKLALLTACAHLFRRADVPPLQQQLASSADHLLSPQQAFHQRIGVDAQLSTQTPVSVTSSKRLSTPDNRIVWDATDPQRAIVRVDVPARAPCGGWWVDERSDWVVSA